MLWTTLLCIERCTCSIRSMTFCYFDLYLKNETLYEFHVIDFFAPYDPRKNSTCIATLLKHVDYISDSFTPTCDPMHPIDFGVHPRSVHQTPMNC